MMSFAVYVFNSYVAFRLRRSCMFGQSEWRNGTWWAESDFHREWSAKFKQPATRNKAKDSLTSEDSTILGKER